MTYEEYFELVKEGLEFYLRPYKFTRRCHQRRL